jgi:predicted 3-demethylubiquinone-9 3-methyltransferase (glyoxalase superfamily)
MIMIKQKIVPHLWYDKEAREAAEFYVSVCPDSKVTNVTTIRNTPSGDCDIVSFELSGQPRSFSVKEEEPVLLQSVDD